MTTPFLTQAIIEQALLEDLAQGDVTVDHLPLLAQCESTAWIRSRQEIVVSGLTLAKQVFLTLEPKLNIEVLVSDGMKVPAGGNLAKISGCTAAILKAERVALNFLQHLSGVATTTRQFVDAIAGTKACIVHTRKTTPGLRSLERQAVLDGGGSLHRYNLGCAVMLKDNHLTQVPIEEAIKTLRKKIGHTVSIEVEAESLEQVKASLDAGADIIMLDNMDILMVQQAVQMIGGRAKIEASGNLTLQNVRSYAEAGVQVLSTSKITLGAPAVDIGLDFE